MITLKERFEKQYSHWNQLHPRTDIFTEINEWIQAVQLRFSTQRCPIDYEPSHYTEDHIFKITVFHQNTINDNWQWTDFVVYSFKKEWTVVKNDKNYELKRTTLKNDDELRDYLYTEVMSTLEAFQNSY